MDKNCKDDIEEPGGKKPELVVYVFNAVEDEWSFISTVADEHRRLELIADCEGAADAYFLATACESDFAYISPKSLSGDFIQYARNLLKYKHGEVLVPRVRTHLICDDFVKDSATMVRLVTRAKEYKRIRLVSYVASMQFYGLKDALLSLGLPVITPEAPEKDSAWTVNFFGSKSGIRQLAQKSAAVEPDFIMPEGLICVGKYDAAKIAANRYIKQKGVVIKTNKGSGGNGVFIFRDGELPKEYDACEKKILEYFNGDRYWDEYPIVIEDLINAVPSTLGNLPNVEFKIHKNGRIEEVFVCDCQVTDKGVFYGLDINEDIINDRLQTRIEDTGYYIAEQYAAAGYRGQFDVDMIYARNGKVYVLESNTRNTGGTDTYKVVKKLVGKDFMDDAYTISRSRYDMFPKEKYTFDHIYHALSPILFDHKKREGVTVNSENSVVDGKLIYVIIGKNKKRAYDLERELYRHLDVEYS
jgi:hypothetical protein